MKRTKEYTPFCLWLKLELSKRGLTNRELADMVGINHRVVSDVMVGRNKRHQEAIRSALEQYDREQAAKAG